MKKLSLFCVICVFGLFTSIYSATTDKSGGLNETEIDAEINSGVSLDDPIIDAQIELTLKMKDAPRRSVKSASKTLWINFQTQQTDYWCGPASASMIVRALGYAHSQTDMANLMGTTTNGTNAGAPVVNALNKVVRGSKFAFRWEWHTYNNVNTIKNHIVSAIDYGNAVMVNTVEGPGDVYLRGHNIGTWLYHYGVVADYFDYGDTVTYVDPGYGRFSGFLMEQRVSIINLSYAVGGRGYAW